ncbi:small membrane protein [Niallia nealsonii AAU1]|nr:small membrane protein [Niallia nealsonii AAU1]
MVDFFKIIAEIVNIFHDIIMDVATILGWQATDKDLHLWIIGIIGIISFFIVQFIFKRLAAWSIKSISFIYTFTLILVLVFAIEIQQGITGRGNMEFADAVAGINGFLLFFGIYLVITLFFKGIKKIVNKQKLPSNSDNNSPTEDSNLPSRHSRYHK